MKNSIIIKITLALMLLSLIFTFGCVDKKSTEPDEILNYDNIDVILIDNWDLWEYQTGRMAGRDLVIDKTRMNSREVEGYPVLVEELYANIEKHRLTFDGFVLDSSSSDVKSVHMMDCQIWTEDENSNKTYYYDYFYNENSGALWLREETTADPVWAVDPTIADTVYVGADSTAYFVSGNDYTLLYRYNSGPRLTLNQPANDTVIPIPGNPDLNDLTPKFKWNAYSGAAEYRIQVRPDTAFSQTMGFEYNQVVTTTQFTAPNDLQNFTMYYWRVKADNSNWSNIWNFLTHQVVLLTGPTNNSFVGLKPTFTWQVLPGAANYTIQITQDANFEIGVLESSTTATSYVPASYLDPNTKYFWRVKGDNSGDHWSDARAFTTSKKVKLNSPQDNATEVVVPVAFDWEDLANTSSYNIQVATDSLFSNIVLDDNSTTSDYLDTGVLQTNLEYFWRVNSDVAYDWSDTLSFMTNDIVLLQSPENDAENVGVITKFIWEKFNTNQTVYVIQVADENTFANPIVDSYIYYSGNNIMCATASLITDNSTDDQIEFVPLLVEDFDPLTVYYWRVQRDGLGWSDVWSFTTLELSGDTELISPGNGDDDVMPLAEFKWENIPGIDYYRLQVSLDPNLADTLWVNRITENRAYTLVNNSTENEMLLVGETYYWRARSDRTDWSEIWSFTVRTGIPYNLHVMGEPEGYNDPDTPNKVDLIWSCLGGSYTHFWVERSDDGGVSWTELGSVIQTQKEYVDFDLNESSDYQYRVRSEYPLGYSDYSEVISVTTHSFVFDHDPEMVAVSAGTFTMGSTTGDDDEEPVRNITLTHDYQMGKLEITNAEFCEVLNWALGKGKIKGIYGNNFNYAPDAFLFSNIIKTDECNIDFSNSAKLFKVDPGMELYPAIGVTWFGAIAYANWLSMIEGVTSLYTGTTSVSCNVYGAEGYRLPTEAEWEFAARGGNSSGGYTYSGSNTIGDVAWYIGNAGDQLHPVGLKAANELLMKDMSGNAWEWCNDKYGVYDPNATTNPIGPTGNISNNTLVSVRGGSWEFDAYHLRNANRSFSKANLAYKVNTNIGFRIVKITP